MLSLRISDEDAKTNDKANTETSRLSHVRKGHNQERISEETPKNRLLLARMRSKRTRRTIKKPLDQETLGPDFLPGHRTKHMEFKSLIDPSRGTVGSIYRDAQIKGERGVVIGDVNHEIQKDLVKDINEAIQKGRSHPDFKDRPFYLAFYEKYDLMLKRGLVRIPKITRYRPYPEQDTMVFHIFPNDDVYFCWELPHRSQMRNILMNPDLFDNDRVDTLRRWENLQLEYFGFTKDSEGHWVENELYRGDKLLGSSDGQKPVKILRT